MLSIFAASSISSASDDFLPLYNPLKLLTFWPKKCISLVPLSARIETSFKISSTFLETSWPLVFGTTQNEQYLLHPSTIETKDDA